MDYRQRTTSDERRDSLSARLSAAARRLPPENRCPACGAEARRRSAKFCLVCGKALGEDYQPLDSVRASYRLQGKTFEFEKKEEIADLFQQNKNHVAQTAWACLVYSMVPYLGILFLPFALVIGGAGYAVWRRRPELGGRRMAVACVALSFVVLSVQLFLWWLLYIIPELGRGL